MFPQNGVLERMTVAEVRDALAAGVRTAILPVGCIEQHGDHLPLNTDVTTAYVCGQRAAAEAGCLVVPPLAYTFSGGELPGTVNVHPHVAALLLDEVIYGLAAQGLTRVIVFVGHGGSEMGRAIRDGLRLFARRHRHWPDLILCCCGWAEFCPTLRTIKDGDFHAGDAETSLMMALAPDLVRPVRTMDVPSIAERLRRDPDAYQVEERPFDHAAAVPRIRQDPAIRVGVMGYPERATKERGEKMAAEITAGLADLARRLAAAPVQAGPCRCRGDEALLEPSRQESP